MQEDSPSRAESAAEQTSAIEAAASEPEATETHPAAKAVAAAPPGETEQAPGKRFTFADMRLQAGDRLQIHCPTHPDRARHISKLIGFLDGVSIITTVPVSHAIRARFMESEIVVVRAFSRNSAYAFKATIEKISRTPFDYMHLSFPKRVEGSVIRKSTRVRVMIGAKAKPDTGSEVDAGIIDLSATGARIRSNNPLGDKGATLDVAFQVNLHEVVTDIRTRATILSTSDGDEDSTLHGLEFHELSAQDRMILRSLIYQQMIENPRSLV